MMEVLCASVTQVEANPFAIDPSDELPVGLQLSWRLRALISTGELTAGERLPSFRRLAEWAGVNVGTVRAVYETLEADGLVVTRHGQGTLVAEGVEAAPQLEEIAADALRRAGEAGLGPRDLAIVAMACASLPGEESETLAGRPRRRRQTARLRRSWRATPATSKPIWGPRRGAPSPTWRGSR